ncbi:Zinc finger A20 and AN1 domain-containing stress-associated protein 8 [Orobanche hederae]
MEHEETGCQPPPEGPILCVNNCGFFGSPTNMNMCSKCYKDAISKQEQAKVAASSIESIVNGSSSCTRKEETKRMKLVSVPPVNDSKPVEIIEPKTKEGPSRCTACKKRVGLTGFKCRCGDLFCGLHRYSDKHDCPFDYQTAGKIAIAKANPVIKAEKLDKI